MKSFEDKNDKRSTNPPLSTSPCPPRWDNGESLSPKIPDWGFEMLQQSKRTLVATRTDKKSLSHLSPFFVEKAIQQFGGVNEMMRCRDGTILFQAKDAKQAEKLHNSKVIMGDCEVKIALSTTAHNTCKAIIRDEDMVHWDQQELLENLADQGVIAIHNVKSRPRSCNDKWAVTPTFIFTFNRPTPPQHLKVGWLIIPTKEYVPEPIRCFQCQRYNHFRTSCKSTAVCSRCSEPEHRPGPCKHGYKCINCGGSHSAAWKGCPVYKEEREIRKVGYRLRIPLSAAKKIYKSYVKKMESMAQLIQNSSSQQFGENLSRDVELPEKSDGWATESSDDGERGKSDAQAQQHSRILSYLRLHLGESLIPKDCTMTVEAASSSEEEGLSSSSDNTQKSRKKAVRQKRKLKTEKTPTPKNRDDMKKVPTEQIEMIPSSPVPKNFKGNSKIS